ncbi:hypothetical protein BDD26_2179 [Xenorhabdus cabanillasii]|uniref:Uncharacterized protein n=1 Tax=Xenorhabdus cabanillasii TaxID=351673 RepID=A0A3D9UN45_9GAMM|nr:hypothetical protein BDD26_2179 [Xenorhabdus cabanillasii]
MEQAEKCVFCGKVNINFAHDSVVLTGGGLENGKCPTIKASPDSQH